MRVNLYIMSEGDGRAVRAELWSTSSSPVQNLNCYALSKYQSTARMADVHYSSTAVVAALCERHDWPIGTGGVGGNGHGAHPNSGHWCRARRVTS